MRFRILTTDVSDYTLGQQLVLILHPFRIYGEDVQVFPNF